jgi:hypothetical protein
VDPCGTPEFVTKEKESVPETRTDNCLLVRAVKPTDKTRGKFELSEEVNYGEHQKYYLNQNAQNHFVLVNSQKAQRYDDK